MSHFSSHNLEIGVNEMCKFWVMFTALEWLISTHSKADFQKSPLRLYGISKQVSWLEKKKPNIGSIITIHWDGYKNLEAVWP